MSLNETPGANRIHIGFYGKRNSGKSSLKMCIRDRYPARVSIMEIFPDMQSLQRKIYLN